MARIPHVGGTNSTFGQRGPDRIGPYQPDTRGMTAGQEALADAARVTGNVAAQFQQQRQQETEQLARAKATNAILDDDLETRAKADEIGQRVSTGDLPWAQAHEEFQTWASQREARTIDGLDPVGMEQYKGGLKRNRFAASAAVENIVEGAKRADFKGQILATRDKLGKFASDPNADIEKIVAQGAALKDFAHAGGLGATFDKDQQDFADNVYTNHAKSRLVANRDNMEGLTQLVHDLSAEDGRYTGKLDADKRTAVLSQVQTRISQLETKAQHEADKGEAAAARVLTKFEAQISSGVQTPLDTATDWAEVLKKGTPEQQAEFRTLLQGEVEVSQVLTKPPTEQRAYVQALKAKQTREGATLAQQGNLRRLESAVDAGLKQLREAPLEYFTMRTGRTVEPLDLQAMLSGDVGAIQTQIADRMNTLATLRKQYGDEAGNAPLLPAEASAIAGALAKATPRSAMQVYGALSKAFADPAAYRAAMQQVAPDSPVRAYAGMVFAEQRATTLQPGSLFSGAVKASSGDVAQTMLEGEALLNKAKTDKAEDGKGPAFPMPPPKEFASEVETFIGSAFAGRPAAYETALQAVRAYYAGSAAKSGDVTGELDGDRVRQAVRAVLGEPVELNDSEVFPPWGMGEDEFTDKVENAWSTLAKSLPDGAPTELDAYGVRQVGNGVYFLVGANGQFLTDRNGKTARLSVTR